MDGVAVCRHCETEVEVGEMCLGCGQFADDEFFDYVIRTEGGDTSEVDPDECGYCGTGTDPEIMCADCWQQMQDDESDVF